MGLKKNPKGGPGKKKEAPLFFHAIAFFSGFGFGKICPFKFQNFKVEFNPHSLHPGVWVGEISV